MMISRERALELLREHVKNGNMVKHCLASEAVMRALARKFGEDEERWGLAGLLHDIDVEITNADLAVHTREAARILEGQGLDQEMISAIRLHNEEAHPGELRHTRFQHALAAGETVTGLIIATALVYPDKKIASVKPSSVVKRMKEKAFARTVNREIIMECEKFGMDLQSFVELSVEAMKEIAPELGL
jgi:putative nucleotidyltransferase with HDIG domain